MRRKGNPNGNLLAAIRDQRIRPTGLRGFTYRFGGGFFDVWLGRFLMGIEEVLIPPQPANAVRSIAATSRVANNFFMIILLI